MNISIIIVLVVVCGVSGAMTSRRMVCYVCGWSVYRPQPATFQMENIDPFLCTHIIYAFAGISGDGSQVMWLDHWNDKGNVQKLNNLKEKNPDLKIMVAVGGWNEGSWKFSSMANNDNLRRNFVKSCVEFMQLYKLDGVDIDWEFPWSTDKQAFVTLLHDLRTALQDGLLLSAPVLADCRSIPVSYDPSQISRYLDFINVMTYDFHGSWDAVTGHNAPLYASQLDPQEEAHLNVAASITCWIAQGADRDKLNVGIPLYGRSFHLADRFINGLRAPSTGHGQLSTFIHEPGVYSYLELCLISGNPSWTRVWNEEIKAPYAVKGSTWVGYDDCESAREKALFLNSEHIEGAMVWSLDTDDFRGHCGQGTFPIVRTVKETMESGGPSPAASTTLSTTAATTAASTTLSTTAATTAASTTATSTVGTTSTTAATTPSQDASAMNCRHNGDALKHRICSLFYLCISMHNNEYGLQEMNCPASLMFNDKTKYCDYPENVSC